MCARMCVCARACVCVREREREREKSHQAIITIILGESERKRGGSKQKEN